MADVSLPALFNTARAAYGPDLLKSEVGQRIKNELRSTPTTDYSLNATQSNDVRRYLGFPPTTSNARMTNSDHHNIQVARNLEELAELHTFHSEEDRLHTISIGASCKDFKRFKTRRNHTFQFHMSENKDIPRTIVPLANHILSSLETHQALLSKVAGQAKSIALRIESFKEVVQLYNENLSDRKRIYLGDEPLPAATRLRFPDSLYRMSPKTVQQYFAATGAIEATAIIFAPDYFINPDIVETETWEMTYSYPVWESADAALSAIWPEVIFALPFLGNVSNEVFDPSRHWSEGWGLEAGHYMGRNLLQMFVRGIEVALKSAIKKYYRVIGTFIKSELEGDFVIEDILGLAFDASRWTLLASKWFGAAKKAIDKRFRKVAFNYLDGYQNGYCDNEQTWGNWIKERYFPSTGAGLPGLVSEVVSRSGEMWTLRLWRGELDDVITWHPQLLPHRRRMRILDWRRTKAPNNPTSEKIYTWCYESDFYQVVSWGIGEPDASLVFEVVATACNRVRRGLSLVSNIAHEGLQVNDKNLINFALNVYLYIHRENVWIKEVEKNQSWINSYKSNAEKLAKTLLSGAAIIGTAGLIIPAAHVLFWLMDSEYRIPFVEEVPELEVQVRTVRGNSRSPTFTSPLELHAVLSTNSLGPNGCVFCQLQERGKLGKQILGVIKCTHQAAMSDIRLTPEVLTDLRVQYDQAIDFHRPLVSARVMESARLFESWVQANGDGVTHKAKVHYLKGPAGSGKSTTIRVLMKALQDSGLSCVMYLPLSKLKVDYENKEVDGERVVFDAETWFKARIFKSADCLFVDECTLADSYDFFSFAAYTGAANIFIVGDEDQQLKTLDGNANPGITDSYIWRDIRKDISEHTLTKCFRFEDEFRLKWMNRIYGTTLSPPEGKTLNKALPRVINRETFRNSAVDIDSTELLVFSHASSQEVFRVVSVQNGGVNRSVYSSQGSTFDKATYVGMQDGDEVAMARHGASLVSMTRSVGSPTFVFVDLDSPVHNSWKQLVRFDDWEEILNDPWPEAPRPARALEFSEVNKADDWVRSRLLSHFKLGDSVPLSVKEYYEAVAESVAPKEVSGADDGVLVDAQEARKGAIVEAFEDCSFKLIPDALFDTYVEEVLKPTLEAATIVSGSLLRRARGAGKLSTKLTVPLDKIKKFADDHVCPMIIYDPAARSFFVRHLPLDLPETWNAVAYKVENGHLDFFTGGTQALPKISVLHNRTFLTMRAWQRADNDFVGNLFSGGIVDINNVGTIKPTLSVRRDHSEFVPAQYRQIATKPEETVVRKSIIEDDEPFNRSVHSKTKFRMGADAYRGVDYIDTSNTFSVLSGLPNPSILSQLQGPQIEWRSGTKLNWQGTWFTRARKSGKISGKATDTYGLSAGTGNVFTGSPNETMRAADRFAVTRPEIPATPSSKATIERMVRRTRQEDLKGFMLDISEGNAIRHKWWKDSTARNYFKRAEIERVSHVDILRMSISNKVQYKPPKVVPGKASIDNSKSGQAIMQTSSSWNANFNVLWREANYVYFKSLKDTVMYESYVSPNAFRKMVTHKVAKLPVGMKVLIGDAKEFDSGQTATTLHGEIYWMQLDGFHPEVLQRYYLARAPGKFWLPGYLKGRKGYEKGSGMGDTLPGNQRVNHCLNSNAVRVVGPSLKLIKGDDYNAWGYKFEISNPTMEFIKRHTNLSLTHNIGTGGEFTGDTVGPRGMYPSIVRWTLKAIQKTFKESANPAKMFAEYQISLRDKLDELREIGVAETVAANAADMCISEATVYTCLEIFNSIAHLSYEQFRERAMPRRTFEYALPDASGGHSIHSIFTSFNI